MNELRRTIICLGNFSARGNHKTEEKQPKLKEDIRSLVEPESQTDPKFQSPFNRVEIGKEEINVTFRIGPSPFESSPQPGGISHSRIRHLLPP
jgi:hypothetical protein